MAKLYRVKWDENEIPDGEYVAAADFDSLCGALRDLLDDLSEDVGQRHHRDKYRVYQVGPQTIEAARAVLTAHDAGSEHG